jgi:hypothetical protein
MTAILEKLAVDQLFNKFFAFGGKRNLISVFTGSRKTKSEALCNFWVYNVR